VVTKGDKCTGGILGKERSPGKGTDSKRRRGGSILVVV